MDLVEDWKWILFATFYAIDVNLPYWAASYWFGLLRNGAFGLEYLAVGLLALFLPRAWIAALVLLAIGIDIAGGVCKSYYLSPRELLENLGAFTQFPNSRIFAVAATIALALLTAAVAFVFGRFRIESRARARTAASLAGFALIFLTAQCVASVAISGHLPNPLRLHTPIDGVERGYSSTPRFLRFSTLGMIQNEVSDAWERKIRRSHPAGYAASPSATGAALNEASAIAGNKGQQRPNLVLILVESWGLANDESIRGALTQPYTDPELLARYRVVQGTVPFFGPTLAGEGRELCGSKIGPHLLDASAQDLQGCLPARLGGLGYRNVAVHGMYDMMFQRRNWYRKIGFGELWFKRRFEGAGLAECNGAYLGTCDKAIGDWLGERLAASSSDPQFVYWVTLGSHLPVPIPAPVEHGAGCSWNPLLASQPAVCSWYQLVANVHHSAVQMAMGKLSRPTVFILVGDHAPPFQTPALRDGFSGLEVPYVVLVPLSESKQSGGAKQ